MAAADAAARLCESLGHRVEVAELPVDGDAFVGDFINAWAAGNAWAMADWERRVGRTAAEEDVEPLTWALVQLGRGLDSGSLPHGGPGSAASDPADRRLLRGHRRAAHPDTGGAAGPARHLRLAARASPLAGLFRSAAYVPFTPPFNVTGQPGISLPLSWNDAGLPIGVQFVGRLGDEETLLALAGQLEEAAPWADRRPPVSA